MTLFLEETVSQKATIKWLFNKEQFISYKERDNSLKKEIC